MAIYDHVICWSCLLEAVARNGKQCGPSTHRAARWQDVPPFAEVSPRQNWARGFKVHKSKNELDLGKTNIEGVFCSLVVSLLTVKPVSSENTRFNASNGTSTCLDSLFQMLGPIEQLLAWFKSFAFRRSFSYINFGEFGKGDLLLLSWNFLVSLRSSIEVTAPYLDPRLPCPSTSQYFKRLNCTSHTKYLIKDQA
jgi:hypothetical protein